MKKTTKKELIGRSVLVVALVAVGISGTGLLSSSYPILTVFGNTLRVVSNAYGASDSIFGDAASSTNTDDNNDKPKDDGDNQGKDQNKEIEQSGDETSTTSSSNIAPQTSSSSDNSEASLSSSDDSTASSPGIQNASIIGIKSDKSYDPNPINVNAGDSVTWTNSDNDIHSVTSGGDEGPSIGQEFDSGILGEGQSFTHRFENPGTYEYFCSIHPSMVGEVIVK